MRKKVDFFLLALVPCASLSVAGLLYKLYFFGLLKTVIILLLRPIAVIFNVWEILCFYSTWCNALISCPYSL